MQLYYTLQGKLDKANINMYNKSKRNKINILLYSIEKHNIILHFESICALRFQYYQQNLYCDGWHFVPLSHP